EVPHPGAVGPQHGERAPAGHERPPGPWCAGRSGRAGGGHLPRFPAGHAGPAAHRPPPGTVLPKCRLGGTAAWSFWAILYLRLPSPRGRRRGRRDRDRAPGSVRRMTNTESGAVVSASTTIDAPPAVVFAIVTDPRQHARIDGSGSVRGVV